MTTVPPRNYNSRVDREQVELIWAAGFFDGEGVTSISAHELRLMVKQNASAVNEVPETLVRFHNAVRVGRIGGPYTDKPTRIGFSPNRRPYFMWYARNSEADAALVALWPELGRAKRAQAEHVKAILVPRSA